MHRRKNHENPSSAFGEDKDNRKATVFFLTHGVGCMRKMVKGDCCICLEQFAGVSPIIAVAAGFPQETENRTVFSVLLRL